MRPASRVGPFVHIYVDEVGYQARIAPEKMRLYTGTENVPVIDEATQGDWYAQLIAMMACDPSVALLNFFHAVDETSLPAWQSGLVLPDGTRRASFAKVKDAILANSQCHSKIKEWRHTERVVGASAVFKKLPRLVPHPRGGGLPLRREGHAARQHAPAHRRVGARGRRPRHRLQAAAAGSRLLPRDASRLRAEMNPARVTTLTNTFQRR